MLRAKRDHARPTPGLGCKVDLAPVFLGNHRVKTVVACRVQTHTWSSAPGLDTQALLCRR